MNLHNDNTFFLIFNYFYSTPVRDQFRGDGIASRGAGYGIPVIRVDGNDVWAVYEATKRARELILEGGRPVMVEAMSYRQGHHSTSDDSTRYREISEIKRWRDEKCPINRMKSFLQVICDLILHAISSINAGNHFSEQGLVD